MPSPCLWRPTFALILALGALGALGPACQRLPEPEPNASFGTPVATAGRTSTSGANDGFPAATGGSDQTGCDPGDQTGCSADAKCTVIVSDGVPLAQCVSDTTIYELWGPCSPSLNDGLDGCPAGSICLEGELGTPLCVPLCRASSDCSDAVCTEEHRTTIRFCAPLCSPLESACAPGLQCRRSDLAFTCQFPRIDDVGESDALCASTDDRGCAEGYACVSGALRPDCDEPQCCTPICDVTNPATCSADLDTCTPLLDSPAPGYEDYGVCVVPA